MADIDTNGEKNEVPLEGGASGEQRPRENDSSDANPAVKETDTAKAEDRPPAEEEKEDRLPEDEESVEQLRAQYEEKIEELDDRFLRLAAEFDNYKKRIARQFDDILKSANERVILQVLEVADNFERALEAASNSADYKSLHSGTELIYQHLRDVLDKEGVEPIEAIGKKFDPTLHEAVMQAESDEYPEGVVAQELARGYRLKGRVIRFSKVVVSKGKTEPQEPSEDGRE
jgi:molecular chaperone GrpE